MNDEDKHTLVEEGTEFAGTMRAKCRVVVRGLFDGELDAPAVEIAETGVVTGILRAKSVRSQGVLAGTVDVDDISVAGTVRSDTVIRAKTLEVRLVAEQGKLDVTFGDCLLEVGDMPGDQPDLADAARADEEVTATVTATAQAADDGPPAGSDADAKPNGRDDEGGDTRARKRRKRDKGHTALTGAEGEPDDGPDDDEPDDDAKPAHDADADDADDATSLAPN